MRNHKVQVKIVDEIPEEKNSFTAYITKKQYESEINRLIGYVTMMVVNKY